MNDEQVAWPHPHTPSVVHAARAHGRRLASRAGLTLVEAVIGLTLIAGLGIVVVGAAVQARRMSEEAIIQNAATSIVYGLVEQMKTVNLSSDAAANQLPSPADAVCAQPHVKLRVDNSLTNVECIVVSSGSPPASTPAATATAASVGATDNTIGPFDLSQTGGVTVQPLTIVLWLWIEPNYQPTSMEPMTRVTLVYSYRINLGNTVRTYRDSTTFVRSNRNIPRST